MQDSVEKFKAKYLELTARVLEAIEDLSEDNDPVELMFALHSAAAVISLKTSNRIDVGAPSRPGLAAVARAEMHREAVRDARIYAPEWASRRALSYARFVTRFCAQACFCWRFQG